MTKDNFPYFSFKANHEYEKKSYNLRITLFYNKKMSRREFEVASDEFIGPVKLLVFQVTDNGAEDEWFDINNRDNSAFVQELGRVIHKYNI